MRGLQLSLPATPREETMNMRLLLTLAGLAIGFVVSALAQEQKHSGSRSPSAD